jgi:NADH:ubiquinone oxidoreductase subunit 2 (subunit N)
VPDVYAGSHTFITAFFATIVKFVLLVTLIRVMFNFNTNNLLDFSATLSMFVGSILTLRQI